MISGQFVFQLFKLSFNAISGDGSLTEYLSAVWWRYKLPRNLELGSKSQQHNGIWAELLNQRTTCKAENSLRHLQNAFVTICYPSLPSTISTTYIYLDDTCNFLGTLARGLSDAIKQCNREGDDMESKLAANWLIF